MSRGFTLIELLVVIGIIAILTALTLPNYRVGDENLALQRSAHKLAQDLRRAQEMAMSAKESNGEPCYGIEFSIDEPDRYILFNDGKCNGMRTIAPGNPDIIIETINLEKNIKIDKIIPNPAGRGYLWITFRPPDPVTMIRIPGEKEEVDIQLKVSDSIKIIKVNKAGLIYVE